MRWDVSVGKVRSGSSDLEEDVRSLDEARDEGLLFLVGVPGVDTTLTRTSSSSRSSWPSSQVVIEMPLSRFSSSEVWFAERVLDLSTSWSRDMVGENEPVMFRMQSWLRN